jgi:hypothetical protein
MFLTHTLDTYTPVYDISGLCFISEGRFAVEKVDGGHV